MFNSKKRRIIDLEDLLADAEWKHARTMREVRSLESDKCRLLTVVAALKNPNLAAQEWESN